jgi:hypothetical protein
MDLAAANVTTVTWLWILPIAVVLIGLGVLTLGLRRVAAEAVLLRVSLRSWDRMAVAIGDLEHDTRSVERDLRRLRRR